MSFDGYQVLQEQQDKDKDLQSVKERMASIENLHVAIQPLLHNIKPEMLTKLQLVGMNKQVNVWVKAYIFTLEDSFLEGSMILFVFS